MKISISIEEAIIFERLLMLNRDDHRMQEYTELGYMESIITINKLRKKLGRD